MKRVKTQGPTATVLDALLDAVRAKFPDDKPSPGIVMSKMKDGRIYASVRRYEGWSQVKSGGQRMASVFSRDTDAAIRDLAKEFYDRFVPPPVYDAFSALKSVLP